MRTKLIALAAVAGVFLAGSASAEGLIHCKRPLLTRIASLTLAKYRQIRLAVDFMLAGIVATAMTGVIDLFRH